MTENIQLKGQNTFTVQGVLNLDDTLTNVDYNVIEKDGTTLHLTQALNLLLAKKVHIKIVDIISGREYESKGILRYMNLPEGVIGFVIEEDVKILYTLDTTLWDLVDKKVSIEIATITSEEGIK